MNNFSIVNITGAYELLDSDGIVLSFTESTPVVVDAGGIATYVSPCICIDADNHEYPAMSVDKFSLDSHIADWQ